MKYPEIQWGIQKVIIDKLDGEKGVERFLRDELFVAKNGDKPFTLSLDKKPTTYSEMKWGIMEAVINKLGGKEGAFKFVRDELVVSAHIIDCDTDPRVHDGFKIHKHIPGGQLEWDSYRVSLQDCREENSNGHDFLKKVRDGNSRFSNGPKMANANVLDFLMSNWNMLPKKLWRYNKKIVFGGTIYSNSESRLFVRCMKCKIYFGDDVLESYYESLDKIFYDEFTAIEIRKDDVLDGFSD